MRFWFFIIEPAEGAGEALAGLPAHREVADLSPIFVVPGAPVAHDLHVEGAADAGDEAAEGEGVAGSVGQAQALAAPLERDGPQAPRAEPTLRREMSQAQIVVVGGRRVALAGGS
jgi:hypothetical protein